MSELTFDHPVETFVAAMIENVESNEAAERGFTL